MAVTGVGCHTAYTSYYAETRKKRFREHGRYSGKQRSGKASGMLDNGAEGERKVIREEYFSSLCRRNVHCLKFVNLWYNQNIGLKTAVLCGFAAFFMQVQILCKLGQRK